MRYFIPASERQGSCYFEFQPGRWRGRCWLPGSILLADERWEALRLTELFGGVLPEFDYFGVTPVSRGQWERIAARSQCEDICPQHLNIRDLLEDVAKVFEK